MKNEYIIKRKSVRKFFGTALAIEMLEDINNKIKVVTPLFPNITYSIDLVEDKNPLQQNARYYLLFNSEEQEGAYENIGFIGEQLSLYFCSIGLGSYFRMGKPNLDSNSNLPFMICMPFGMPAEPLFRGLSEFRRKKSGYF